MRKNSLPILKILIFLGILIVLIIIVIYLSNNQFFLNYKNSDFNDLMTPIFALFSIVVLVYTLMESQKYNKNLLAMDEYKIMLQDFEIIKLNLENLKFKIKLDQIPEHFENDLRNANGVDYIHVFHSFFLLNDTQNPFITNITKTELKSSFRTNVIFPLVRNYKNVALFIEEVANNKLLESRYKRKLYLKVEQQLLQHYFRICNNIDSSRKQEYNLKVFDSNGFNSNEFFTLNELFIKDDLFQINDLNYYKNNN